MDNYSYQFCKVVIFIYLLVFYRQDAQTKLQ